MAKGKKFDYRTVQEKEGWKTEITRQVTSRRTMVSKSQSGFSTQEEARAWGKSELESFLLKLKKKNTQKNQKRAEKSARPE